MLGVICGLSTNATASDDFFSHSEYISGFDTSVINNFAAMGNGDFLYVNYGTRPGYNVYLWVSRINSGQNQSEIVGDFVTRCSRVVAVNPSNNNYTIIYCQGASGYENIIFKRYDSNNQLIFEGGTGGASTPRLSDVYDAVARSNGDVIVTGDYWWSYTSARKFDAFRVANNGSITSIPVWGMGQEFRAHRVVDIGSGNILFAGDGGNWQIYGSNNAWGIGGTAPISGVKDIVVRSNGEIVLLGGQQFCVYSSGMGSLLHTGNLGFTVTGATLLPNGYIMVAGGAGSPVQYRIIKPNNSVTGITNIETATQGKPILFWDGNHVLMLMLTSSYSSGAYSEAIRRCKFEVYPTVVSQTQTSVNLSWTVSTPGAWNYQIERRAEGSSDWVLIQTQTGSSFNATGL